MDVYNQDTRQSSDSEGDRHHPRRRLGVPACGDTACSDMNPPCPRSGGSHSSSWTPDWHLICCDQDHGGPSRQPMAAYEAAHASSEEQKAATTAAQQAWLAYCCTDESCQVPEAPLAGGVETICCDLDHDDHSSEPTAAALPLDLCRGANACDEPDCEVGKGCNGGDCCYLSRCVSGQAQRT